MRVTNTMISNSSQSHILKAKNKLLKYQEQYTSQQKIQRPSDDPTVAVRSLKLRTTYSQLSQFAEKNIKDAMSWMDTTESAMSNMATILTNMKGYLNQGACDELETDDRNSVVATLKEYVKSIFHDEANTDYSGRYVFSGFRTDTSLLFPADTDTLKYKIKENFVLNDIDAVKSVIKGNASADGVEQNAVKKSMYRMQVAYDECKKNSTFSFVLKNKDGNNINLPSDIQINVMDPNTTPAGKERDIADKEIRFIADTGEILIGKDAYQAIKAAGPDTISVGFEKEKFRQNDVRPEMYFEAVCNDTVNGVVTEFTEPKDQEIKYEVNFNQTLSVNTQARDAIDTDIYRNIDYIAQCVKYVDEVDKNISETKKKIANTTDTAELSKLNNNLTKLENEKKLRVSVMTEAFGLGLTMVDKTLDKLSVATAELGAKYKRAELTHEKLLDERLDTEDKLSENEGVELSDAVINLTQADNLYQASLSATAKILGNSLLNYI